MGHMLQGVEGTYSHVTLAMELAIAEHLQRLWEGSLKVVWERRELGPYPLYLEPSVKPSPKRLPKAS